MEQRSRGALGEGTPTGVPGTYLRAADGFQRVARLASGSAKRPQHCTFATAWERGTDYRIYGKGAVSPHQNVFKDLRRRDRIDLGCPTRALN